MEEQIIFQNHLRENLSGSLHLPSSRTRFGVILGHCFTCSRHTRILKDICEELNHRGIMALRFDFSGNGKSEGSFTESTHSKQILEMETAKQVLEDQGANWIGLAGHSMGGSIAVLTAARNNWVRVVATIGSRFSVVTIDHILPEKHQAHLEKRGEITFMSRGRKLTLTPAFFEDARQHQLSEAAGSLNRPLLIIHGDQDEIVPLSEAEKGAAFGQPDSELAVISGADHMFLEAKYREDAAIRIAQWFERQTNQIETV